PAAPPPPPARAGAGGAAPPPPRRGLGLQLRAVLLGGPLGLFFRGRPSRSSARKTAEVPQATPVAARSSSRVASGQSATALRSRSALSPWKAGGWPPPWGLGAIEPVSRRRARSLYTQATLTQNRLAICSRVPSPRSQAATTRSLRSIE